MPHVSRPHINVDEKGLSRIQKDTLTLSLEAPAASTSAAPASPAQAPASGGDALELRSRALHRDAPPGSRVPRGVAALPAAALRQGTAVREDVHRLWVRGVFLRYRRIRAAADLCTAWLRGRTFNMLCVL